MTEQAESGQSYDEIWDEIYGRREALNKYPFDGVVSFLFRNRSLAIGDRPLRVLEVGCGACNNLWFAAREGCAVAGIDASADAIGFGRARFEEEGLEGDLRVGDFSSLPFEDGSFDIAINRGALSQTGRTVAAMAVGEVWRTLRSGGKFYSELFGQRTTANGSPGHDGVTLGTQGRLSGVGQICFYEEKQVMDLYSEGWSVESLMRVNAEERISESADNVEWWIAVAEKT